MKPLMKKKFLLTAAFFVFTFSFASVSADEPLPSLPESYTKFSQNKEFFLIADGENGTTTCYKMTKNGSEERWRIPAWSYFAYISDNGKFCVLDDKGGLLNLDSDKNTVLFAVYLNGELYDQITLSKIIDNKRSLKRTASHYYYGEIRQLRDDGILLETVEGLKRYDFATKSVELKGSL